jgi:hypothetical protein
METHKIHYLFTNLFQLIMKLFISILFTALAGFIFQAKSLNNLSKENSPILEANYVKEKPCTISIGFHFWGKLRKRLENPSDPKNPCSDRLGISCLGTKPFVEVSKLNPLQLGDNDEQIIFTLLSNNTIQLDFIHSDRRNNVFEIEADYVIASEVSSKLGKRRIVLRKGNYSVSFNSDGTATVKITISSN